MKRLSYIFFIVLISCTKQKEESCVEITMTTFVNGVEIKRVTSPWYDNGLMASDTIWCDEEMIVSVFHKCGIK